MPEGQVSMSCEYKKGKKCIWIYQSFNFGKEYCIKLRDHCCFHCKESSKCKFRCSKLDRLSRENEDNPSKRYIREN